MNDGRLVSVIMPTYQRGWIIERAIKSVLNQTYSNFELLVIDNGSTDDTLNKLKQFSDPRLKLLTESNRGASNARNHGLKLAKGELIAYLDTDNTWAPEYLEAMVEGMDNQAVMAYSGQNLLLVGDDMKIIGRRTRNQGYDPVALLKRNYIDLNCMMHIKGILNEIGGFDPTMTAREDWDLVLRIILTHPLQVRHIDQVFSNYYHFLPGANAKTSTNLSLPVSEQLNFYGVGAKDEERRRHVKLRMKQYAEKGFGLDTSYN